MAKNHFSFPSDTGSNISGELGISEHTVVRVMAGETEKARVRLADALEQLGYRVLDENPLRAKHGARGAGAYYFSANALDYPTTLNIGLKQHGTGSTRVTFEYAVIHGYFGKGDRQSLTREAEAILALASQRVTSAECLACGTEFVADSKYCRKCGAPTQMANAPAELEVMRLTANGRAGHQWTVIGLTILAFSSFLPMLIWLLGHFASLPKGGKVTAVFALLGAIFGTWALLAGIWRTHLTLNPRDLQEPEISPIPRRHSVVTPNTNELPQPESAPVPLSITEGTTSLLSEVSLPERAPVFALRNEERAPE